MAYLKESPKVVLMADLKESLKVVLRAGLKVMKMEY